MDVIVVGRDPARGAAVVSEIEEAGGRARIILVDDRACLLALARDSENVIGHQSQRNG
jgi:hypothetical protein